MDINLIAPINQLGYGIVSLNILKSLTQAGNNVSLFPLGNLNLEAPVSSHDLLKDSIEKAKLFNPTAPSLRIWHQFDMSLMAGKGLHTGLPIFELNKFTDIEKHQLSTLDKIFVPTEWAREICVENGLQERCVVVVPFGVDRFIFSPKEVSNPIANNKATKFFNIGKWEIRKGHGLLLDAFNKAFKPEDDVMLIMNPINPFIGDKGNHEWAESFKTSPMGEKILIVGPRLKSQQEVSVLINSCDCGVFPALAEGWNMELLETMSCGKTAICTNYSGHREYVTKDNAYLIDIDKTEDAYDGIWFNGQGEWAQFGDPQLEQLINYMKIVHVKKQSGQLSINQDGIETAAALPWEQTQRTITQWLK